MKYLLFLLTIFYVTSFNKVSYADKSDELLMQGAVSSRQEPFYFITPVPASVKLFDRINLSFFRNKLTVLQYRYRLQTPYGSQTSIDGQLIIWSAWIKDDLTEIKIPRLDQEGGYKLIIEYKPQTSNETKKFEKLFYVYYVNPLTSAEAAKSKTVPSTGRTAANTTPVTSKPVTGSTAKTSAETSAEAAARTSTKIVSDAPDKTPPKTPPKTTARTTTESTVEKTANTTAKPVPAVDNLSNERKRLNDRRLDLKDIKIKVNIIPKVVPQTGNLTAESSKKPVIVEKSISPEYDILLAEAIEKKDTALFSESIRNGAGTTLRGKNGGNIFHLMNGTFSSENLISIIKNRGFSINEIDNSGNSPLHLAILTGENRYAFSLINQGADLNIKNNLELSPLHLAVLLNDLEVVNELLKKGAAVDMKGNSGYTPLHIASEMNNIEIAKDLILKGAKNRIKTDQGLSPKAIAKIQDNNEMIKLILKKDSYTISSAKSISIKSMINVRSDKQNPIIDFNLPYDKQLAKKRQFNKVLQVISVPVFALSAAYTTYLKIQANHYYSLSKIAETEEIAKRYYDKTVQFDTFSYISGGVSLVSAYGVIHSTIRKGRISKKMHKTFN